VRQLQLPQETVIALLDSVLAVLNDPARKADHYSAILLLGPLSSKRERSSSRELRERKAKIDAKLEEILIHGDPELLSAALATAARFAGSIEPVMRRLGDKVTDERRKELEQAAEEAEELSNQGGGGMGGGGGGGMF
jgi:predicted glycosyltransferase